MFYKILHTRQIGMTKRNNPPRLQGRRSRFFLKEGRNQIREQIIKLHFLYLIPHDTLNIHHMRGFISVPASNAFSSVSEATPQILSQNAWDLVLPLSPASKGFENKLHLSTSVNPWTASTAPIFFLLESILVTLVLSPINSWILKTMADMTGRLSFHHTISTEDDSGQPSVMSTKAFGLVLGPRFACRQFASKGRSSVLIIQMVRAWH